MAKTEEEKAAERAAKEAEKRAKLLTELETLGITATSGTKTIAPLIGSETVERLAELVKSAKTEAKEAEKATNTKSTDPIVVKYRDFEGKPTERTFSLDLHGEDFAKLAEEFKTTNAAKLITE